MRPCEWASYLIGKYGTDDPFELCGHVGISVYKIELGSLNGFFTLSDGTGHIYINAGLDGPAQRAICAHELGHAILHTDINIRFLTECTFFSPNRFEREANRFGAYLLLNDIAGRIGDYEGWTYPAVAAQEYVPVAYVEIVFMGGLPPTRVAVPVPAVPRPEPVVDKETIKPVLDEAARREKRVAAFMRRVRKRLRDMEPERVERRQMMAEGKRRRPTTDEFMEFIKTLR
jgi:hypothetical protein